MTDAPAASSGVARFRDPAGHVTGAGFLVTSERVVTCAHVLGDGHAEQPPDGPVTVEDDQGRTDPPCGPRGG